MKRIAWGLVTLIVVLTIFKIEPRIFEKGRWRADYIFRRYRDSTLSPNLASQNFKSRLEESWQPPEIASFYRMDAHRSGVDPVNKVSTNLQVDWQFADLNIGLHGASKASPAVDESGVYVGGDSGWFYAFNHDGKLRWRFHLADAWRGIHATAILTRHRVCFGGYNGDFFCLDKQNGNVIWTMSGLFVSYGASPMFVKDSFVLGIETTRLADGFVARISNFDGRVIWRSVLVGEQIHSSPSYSEKTNSVYVGANNGFLFRIDFETGRIVWKVSLGGPIKSTPLITDTAAFVTSWAGTLFRVNLQSGEVEWSRKLSGPSQSSPTLIPESDAIVVGDSLGGLFGINKKSGVIVWQKRVPTRLMASAVAIKDSKTDRWLAWMPCEENTLCALVPQTGKTLARLALPSLLTGQPVAFHNSLYLALDFPGGLVKFSPTR